MVINKAEKKQYLKQGHSKGLVESIIVGLVDKRGHSNKQANDDCLVSMIKDSDGRIGRCSTSCYSSLRRGRQKNSVKACGSIRRSARTRCSGTQSSEATVSTFCKEVSGSEGACLEDQVAYGLERNSFVRNVSEDMEISKLHQSDRSVYYCTSGFKFVMYCFLTAYGRFPHSPAHAKELLHEGK